MQAEKERLRKEEEERRAEEEYRILKESFVVEEEGEDAANEDEEVPNYMCVCVNQTADIYLVVPLCTYCSNGHLFNPLSTGLAR